MRTRLLFLFILLLPLTGFAQLTSNLSIFSESEDKFTLYLNGKKMNDKPLPEVRLEGLTEPYYDAKIVFEDRSLPDLYKKLQLVTPQGDPSYALYKIKQDREGKLIVYFLSNVPIKDGLTGNDNKAFNQYGRDVTKDYVDQYSNEALRPTGGVTTIVTSTTTTTTTLNEDNAAVVMNNNHPASLNNDNNGGSSTTTSSSSSSSAPAHATLSPSDIEKGGVEPTPPPAPKGRKARRAAAKAAENEGVEVVHMSGVNNQEEEKKTFSENDTTLRAIMEAKPAAKAPAETQNEVTTTTSSTIPENPADTVGRSNPVYVEGPANCPALDEAAFNTAVQSVSQATDEDEKLAAAKKVVDANCVTTDQLVMMNKMIGRDRLRLELDKYAYPRTTDPRQYRKVTMSLEKEGNQHDLEDYINYVNNNR